MTLRTVLVSWSSGKDSAWMLHVLRQTPGVAVAGLVTTFDESTGRVAVHGVSRELVEAQAAAAGLPLWPVSLPWPCSNLVYEQRTGELLRRARDGGITHLAFGDLFLGDIRAYRERLLAGSDIEPLFPLWTAPERTPELARAMIAGGLQAVLTCVDAARLDASFAGRAFDLRLLADLPADVDPCGERGEFHTFCHGGPMFASGIPVAIGAINSQEGFHRSQVRPAGD